MKALSIIIYSVFSIINAKGFLLRESRFMNFSEMGYVWCGRYRKAIRELGEIFGRGGAFARANLLLLFPRCFHSGPAG